MNTAVATAGRLRLYLNTSVVIRALEDPPPPGARGFLEECCRRHRCLVSSVHWEEPWRPETMREAVELLERLGVENVGVDVRALARRAYRMAAERGWSPRRRLDLMHLLAAVELGCHGVVAVDRFIARRAREYGLLYVNHYTGCP
ncbi:hypothetical protein Pdsh_06600 [Pyrodictium delaneyi]|uniref:PIN domain-containing protein n=1 Tax=Pyrodictium delaneyi TaxID=1273541 RepID=A0A211YNQ6_9CREN|nr:hypothetical protein Pdsh_06600 [Pyrodictium delaneyi]